MIRGRAWKYGDDVNTDVIFPGRYTYARMEPEEMAKHALEDLDPSFAKEVRPGDVIVAGRNFGCGSSREQAATCLVACGVGAIVAKSFARIFFRNAINSGLPALEIPQAVDAIEAGDEVTIDLRRGVLIHKDVEYEFPPLPKTVLAILEDGGLIPHLKKALSREA
ncbi:MAG: 3-isopropylmalate dehydratase small subunit [Acetothermia bacterium 64_32]|nr:MAG: 3-isopropylmalate dehydratase small subunit [Acetothermia bacterium 64_32]HAF70673.1 3-isopropylmalate dehydratase [Candidatus Acetothermia bacterium]